MPWKTILASSIASDKAPSTRTKPSRGNRYAILEVPSQQIRNKLLSDVSGQDIHFTCLTQAITISRAKTQQQRDRNTIVSKAFDKIKSHDAAKNKSVTIEFKIPDSWDRSVSVDKQVVFLQRPGETLGTFSGAFAALSM